MSLPCYIGDEATAAGYRLAGARTLVPRAGAEGEALASARASATLVLISAGTAARVPPRELAAACASFAPLTLVVPDLRGEPQMPDLALRLRAQLGLEETR